MAAQVYAKINISTSVVISLQQIDPTQDVLDTSFIWASTAGITCSDGRPILVGCIYTGSVFTSMPKDNFGRSVSMTTDGVTDTYIILDPYGNDGILSFAANTLQITVYAAINAAAPTLSSAISANLKAFNAALLDYVGAYITTETKLQFFILYYLAVQNGLSNRAAYIQPILTWAESIVSYASTYAASIEALTTPIQVYSTTWNFSSNTGSVPNVTLIGAITISN